MLRAILVPAAVSVGALGLAGCSGDSSSPTATETDSSDVLPHPTTAPQTGDTVLAPGAEVLRFDLPGDISCVPDTALVEVSYATSDLDAVGFVVDGQPVQTGAAPPTSGTFGVPVPCDGKVHTLMLIGSGAGGPAFATKAVVTRPT